MPEDIANPLAPAAANLRLLERILREHPYEVRPFLRGPLAPTSAAQEPPNLILLDINMPEMTGTKCVNG
jgi:CheY-like chemotaxis protein